MPTGCSGAKLMPKAITDEGLSPKHVTAVAALALVCGTVGRQRLGSWDRLACPSGLAESQLRSASRAAATAHSDLCAAFRGDGLALGAQPNSGTDLCPTLCLYGGAQR